LAVRAIAFIKTWETRFAQYFESMGVVAISVGYRAAISRENEATISGLHDNLAVDVETDAPGGISSDDDISTT
jgi:LPS sulfotransferase NodH